MLHAGIPRLLAAGACVPAHDASIDGGAARVALEAYPGLLARELIGRRSYKADDKARQTAEREAARADLLDALALGSPRLGIRLALDKPQRQSLLQDAQGDRLDAVLCLVQAAWAAARPGWGLPATLDPLEGWIVSA
jgi:Protein of unknown function (DUF429)